MDENHINELERNADQKYKNIQIEPGQKVLIDLIRKLGLKIIGINEEIIDETKKTLTDLDIVAYFEGNIIIFNVKNQKEKRFPNLEEFSGHMKDLSKYIQDKYGKEPNTKYKYVHYDATASNHRDNYLKNKINNIVVLFKTDIDYFIKICEIEPRLARNDFLSMLNIVLKGKTDTRTAIVYKINDINVYMLFVSPKDLFECVVIPRKRDIFTGLSAFQRSIDKNRLKSIKDYIIDPESGFAFPNTILLASDKEITHAPIYLNPKLSENKKIVGDESDSFNTRAVSLQFPLDYGVLKLIDGQHRLLGYSKTEYSTQENGRFPVLILEGLEDKRKAKVFLDINSKAKPVDSNLKLLISSEIEWVSKRKRETREKNIVKHILRLVSEEVLSEQKDIFLGHAGNETGHQPLNLRTMVSAIYKTRLDKTEDYAYKNLKSMIINLKISENKDFYLKNIGFRILCNIVRKCLDDLAPSWDDNSFESVFVGLIKRLDSLSDLNELGYGEGGANKRANALMYELKSRFPKEFENLKVDNLQKL